MTSDGLFDDFFNCDNEWSFDGDELDFDPPEIELEDFQIIDEDNSDFPGFDSRDS